MHTDACTCYILFPSPKLLFSKLVSLTRLTNFPGFRLLLLPHLIYSPNPTVISHHLRILDSLTTSIFCTFPAGLYTPIGILIANPAYSTNPAHPLTFTSGAYHGTVVWAWNSIVMLTKGLEVQLSAASSAEAAGTDALSINSANPALYNAVKAKMKRAYAKLWELIEANREHLSNEVWSWRWDEGVEGGKGGFAYTPLGCLPAPGGEGQTESNAVQLWSLTFLALERRRELEV